MWSLNPAALYSPYGSLTPVIYFKKKIIYIMDLPDAFTHERLHILINSSRSPTENNIISFMLLIKALMLHKKPIVLIAIPDGRKQSVLKRPLS
jgi:hypothetical protein